MNKLIIIASFVLILYDPVFCADADKFIVPDVTIEALKNGALRAYIPDSKGLKFFAFHAKLNQPIVMQDPGDYSMEQTEKNGDFWITSFPNMHVKLGDTLYYWIFCHVNRLGYGRDNLNVTISELLDEFPSLKSRCVKSATVTNGEEVCVGDVIVNEQFSDSVLDDNKWLAEQWIPTYTSPSFFFNSYINKDETRFVRDGILYLKPIALQSDTDVRGILDLRNGCTSNVDAECYFRAKAYSLLPPVQSAKITSKRSFKYGDIEIRAKLPAGEWLIPVIRLEQKTKENGESSPVAWIAYSRGNEDFSSNGKDFGATFVFGGPVLSQTEPSRSSHLVSTSRQDPFYNQFHKYSLKWQPGKMTFCIDDVEYGSVDLNKDLVSDIDVRNLWNAPEAPFNKEYVLSLGVAVGGLTDFPDGFTSGGNAKPWSNGEPKFIKEFYDHRSVWSKSWIGDSVALQVDYVKVTAV